MHAAGLSNEYPGQRGSVSGGVSGPDKASVGFEKEIVVLCVSFCVARQEMPNTRDAGKG